MMKGVGIQNNEFIYKNMVSNDLDCIINGSY